MLKKMKVILAVLLIGLMFLNSGCGLFKKKNKDASEQQAAQQLEDSSMKKLITDYIEKLYKKTLPEYDALSASGTIPVELWDYISGDTLKLSEGNPEIRINYPRAVVINSLVLGEYKLIKDNGKPEISCDFVGKAGDISTYLVKVNLKAKCINVNDIVSIIKKTMDVKTALIILKAASSEDYSALSDEILNKIRKETYNQMKNKVSAANKLDYIKVQFSYDIEVRKEDGKNKIVSFQESEKVKGYNNRLSIMNDLPVTRLPYLDTIANQKDIETYTKESTLITDYFNKLCGSLDNEKMELMAAYWNKGDKDFISYLEKIGKSSDKKAKSLVDMMYIAGDYKTKFPYDSFPILTNMEKINGGLSNLSIKIHPAYSEKRREYIVSFQAPVQKINGSVEGYTTNCCYDYSVTLAGKGDKLKISRMIMNEHYYMN